MRWSDIDRPLLIVAAAALAAAVALALSRSL